jgi:CRISPR-associated protein Csm1
MEEKIFNAALAGLLHDIGKFSQRAGEGLSKTWNHEAKEDYKYQHALASYGFVQKHVPVNWRQNLTGIAYHHHPKTQHDIWIQLADHLSSSERLEDTEDKPIPHMQSIFCNLAGYQQNLYLPLERLNPSIKSGIFPQPVENDQWKEDDKRSYKKLWDLFDEACTKLVLNQLADPQEYLEKVYALLQEFTWCIPSASQKNISDVSLFDHSRTTAAIAACLAKDQRSVEWCTQAKQNNSEVCLLVGADISGIQNFIYTLASSGAAKSLRARSFYLQLLCEVIAYELLDCLEIPITNLLFVGGGGFQLLAPLTSTSKLDEASQFISDQLLTLHQGSLGTAIKWVPVCYKDFESFNNVYHTLGIELNYAKRQPFSISSSQKLAHLLCEPGGLGGDPLKFCTVTGEDGKCIDEDLDGNFKSRFVLSLESLGNLLPNASEILLSKIVPKPATERAVNWRTALQAFGMDVQIVTDKLGDDMLKPKNDFIRVWQLKSTVKHISGSSQIPYRLVRSYRPFAQITPTVKDKNGDSHPMTTDDLSLPARGKFIRWGVLRMDVDNLGNLFRTGFGENASLSRIASLSFALRLFFEGWISYLPDDKLKDHVYLQYSGGDDLFLIGSWDVLPVMALNIQQSFREYTAFNPAVTISCGITIVEKGFPIYQAARWAGDAEASSKAYLENGKQKNAVTFLDKTMSWESLDQIKQHAYVLADLIDQNKISHSLLQTILNLNAQADAATQRALHDKKAKPVYGPWTWMAAYQLSRVIQKLENKKDKNAVEVVTSLRDTLISANVKSDTALAARWTQYLTRGG